MVTALRNPDVSIVICTYNRAELLRETLQALPRLHGIGKAEIVIVDNRSTDHTRSVSEYFIKAFQGRIAVRYVYEPRQGLSVARNTGVRAARGEIAAFLDDDAIPEAGWLSAIVTTFGSKPELCGMGGPIAPRFEQARPAWLAGPLELPYTIVNLGNAARAYPSGLHPYGANMAVRKRYLEANPFPAELGRQGALLLSGEESWLFDRMRENGKETCYHPDMAVVHFIPASRLTRDWIRRRYYCQGVTNGMLWEKKGKRWRAYARLAFKAAYAAANSVAARSESRKLLSECRLQSVRGTLDWLREREYAAVRN